MNIIEISKKTAGEKGAEYIRDGMVIGLGTGSTVRYTIEAIANRIKYENLDIIGIPTSNATEKLALSLGIKISSLEEYSEVDLCIDGADEVDSEFNLIKGAGGAHTMEKIVSSASKRFIVVVDKTKMVEKIGKLPVPVEFISFGKRFISNELRRIGGYPELRENFRTDNGNLIFDTKFHINNPSLLEDKINSIPGVIENGVFSKRRPEMIIVGDGNNFRILNRSENG